MRYPYSPALPRQRRGRVAASAISLRAAGRFRLDYMVKRSGKANKLSSTVANGQRSSMAVAAINRPAGSPCILSAPEWAAISGDMGTSRIFGCNNAFFNHGSTGSERDMRPLSTNIAISHREIAGIPKTVSAVIFDTMFDGILSALSSIHTRIWVSRMINALSPIHRKRGRLCRR